MSVTALLSEARSALAQGQVERSASVSARIIRTDTGNAEALFLLGLALAEMKQIGLALQALGQAVEHAPAKAEYQAQLARLLSLSRQEQEARHTADRARILAERSKDADARTYDTIGCVYARLGDHENALPLFARAVAAEPDSVPYRRNFAISLGFFGKIAEAEEQYEAILTHQPHNGAAHLGLAGLRRQTASRNHIARLEESLRQAPSDEDIIRIRHAAAKEYEDIGDADACFAHLSLANKAVKQSRGYSLNADTARVTALMEAFSRPGYFMPDSPLTDQPVFIVGLPRTGTTLVDTILSAHPDIRAAGELQAMPLAIKHAAQTKSRFVLDPETIHAVGAVSPAVVGEAYLTRARAHEGAKNGRFTDKLPLNFLNIGHIARALPHAPIICLRRSPMDTIWATYKMLFAPDSPYYGWSYDVMDCAGFYALFDRLMAYWKTLFPGRIFELSYEGLIADQEGETRRLLDHCGLGWDDRCLRFHETAHAVATPSAQQVRSPLNAGSVGKWRAYARHLEPARIWLEEQGITAD